MFKIENPIINLTENKKYLDIINKSSIYESNFENDTIDLSYSEEVNSSKFNKIIFTKTILNRFCLIDVIFENCDLSNITFVDSTINRVVFKNCKLVGTSFINCSLQNILIEDSLCNYINLSGNKMKYVLIKNSSFIESSFIEDKFKYIEFDNINLDNSEFNNTSLKDIDLSSCNITNLKINLYDLRGSIINNYQSMDLIGLLGVKIKE